MEFLFSPSSTLNSSGEGITRKIDETLQIMRHGWGSESGKDMGRELKRKATLKVWFAEQITNQVSAVKRRY